MLTLVTGPTQLLIHSSFTGQGKIRKVGLREGDHLSVIVKMKQIGLGENEFNLSPIKIDLFRKKQKKDWNRLLSLTASLPGSTSLVHSWLYLLFQQGEGWVCGQSITDPICCSFSCSIVGRDMEEYLQLWPLCTDATPLASHCNNPCTDFPKTMV